jgi:hypothetical protein
MWTKTDVFWYSLHLQSCIPSTNEEKEIHAEKSPLDLANIESETVGFALYLDHQVPIEFPI